MDAVPGLSHQLLPYLTDREYLLVLVPFLAEGHARGDRMLVISTSSRFHLLRSHLPGDANLQFIDSGSWYRGPGEAMAAAQKHFHADADGTGMRVIGEPPWAQCPADELAEWACYEAAFNLAFAADPLHVVCPYRIPETPSGALAEAHRTHPEVTGVPGARPCANYVAPEKFSPAWEPDLPGPPPSAVSNVVHGGSCEDVARLATRRALELGVFGRAARNFGLAAHEAAAQFFAERPVHAQIKVWTARRELVADLLCRGPTQPRITGYLPPHPADGSGDRLWLTRRLCRLVRLSSTPYGMRVRLHFSTA
jgi:hypothetical protein